MSEMRYGVEVNVYAYDDDGEVEGECQNVGCRGELTKCEAIGICKRLTEHLKEFTTASDSLEDEDNEAVRKMPSQDPGRGGGPGPCQAGPGSAGRVSAAISDGLPGGIHCFFICEN